MENALNRLDGVNDVTVQAIIALHRNIYKPQFESVESVASIAVNGIFTGAGLYSVLTFVASMIAKRAGLSAIPVAGWVLSVLWLGYDVVTKAPAIYDESKRIANERQAVDNAKYMVEKNVENNQYAKYAIDAANRTCDILMKHGGNLLDKVDAVGKSASHAKDMSSTTTMSDDAFEEKFGFTKDLNIVDASTALNHSLQFFYLMIGMNEYGNKVINKKSYSEFNNMFEEYWEENRDFLPYFNEDAARAKMLKEFTQMYYNEFFLPEYKKKLGDAVAVTNKNKSVDELADEGRNEFGDVVDKDKYYAAMGFRKDGKITDVEKFSKAFSIKTGLDLNYNPITPEGKRLLERMLKNPSDEYMKYLPAPVFLMTDDDKKPFIAKAKDPHRRGESMLGRYGDDAMGSYSDASSRYASSQQIRQEQNVSNDTKRATGSATTQSEQTVKPNQNIANANDTVVTAGPWHTIGKEALADLYKKSNDRLKHLMRLGYILNIKNGKFYRMSDEDRKVMPQVVYAALEDDSRVLAEKRRQVKLQQGKLTRADMTEDEIAASNRRAGFPEDI
jgi:hypothetical protein